MRARATWGFAAAGMAAVAAYLALPEIGRYVENLAIGSAGVAAILVGVRRA